MGLGVHLLLAALAGHVPSSVLVLLVALDPFYQLGSHPECIPHILQRFYSYVISAHSDDSL